MQVQPNFTAKYVYSNNDEERKIEILKDSYKAGEGLASAAVTYGILETVDKFQLTKNKQNRTAEEIAKLAKSHTKRNLLFGLLGGVLGYAISWPWYKYCEPMQLKIRRWADNQNRIAEKAEQLIKEENAAKKSENQNILKLQGQIINQNPQKYTFLNNNK